MREQLLAWARQGAPREVCGLLLEAEGKDGGPFDLRAVLIPNAVVGADAERRFELDPVAWVAAEQAAQSLGEVVVGMWHSHPDGPPRPSVVDAKSAEMMPSTWDYVIVDLSSAGSPGEITVWRRC